MLYTMAVTKVRNAPGSPCRVTRCVAPWLGNITVPSSVTNVLLFKTTFLYLLDQLGRIPMNGSSKNGQR